MAMDTIYALASGRGAAGVAVIRLSGPQSFEILDKLTRRHDAVQLKQLSRRDLYDPENGDLIDRAMVVRFAGPRSFTGEDMVELHMHGGRAVIEGIYTVLAAQQGTRLADPGEFSRRAFQNGKIDLLAAEAVNDLVQAETARQRQQALAQHGGTLSQTYDRWRGELIRLSAILEAEIDFPDEDLPENLRDSLAEPLTSLKREMMQHLDDGQRGERLRDGVRVAILGAPNVGKSSLLNALAARDVAIVSDQPGTTRDVIEVHLDLAGFPVILSDTAGLRETEDRIEDEGIRRAQSQAARADVRLILVDVTDPVAVPPHLDEKSPEIGEIHVVNKIDLAAGIEEERSICENAIEISAKTGAGLDTLVAALTERVKARFSGGEAVWLTRQRHRARVEAALAALDRAESGQDVELIAEDVRLAVTELGRLTGKVDVEDVLDVVFFGVLYWKVIMAYDELGPIWYNVSRET